MLSIYEYDYHPNIGLNAWTNEESGIVGIDEEGDTYDVLMSSLFSIASIPLKAAVSKKIALGSRTFYCLEGNLVFEYPEETVESVYRAYFLNPDDAARAYRCVSKRIESIREKGLQEMGLDHGDELTFFLQEYDDQRPVDEIEESISIGL